MYDDDPQHPIPKVDSLDLHAVRKAGGSDLVLVIAAPLEGDERSQQRLLTKIENYLRFMRSSDYERQCGRPTSDNSSVIVRIHPKSDPLVFDLLERCKAWVSESGTQLVVSGL